MTTAALILAAVLAVAAVLFVARPFLRFLGRERVERPDDEALARTALLEARDRALLALKDLEFDHRTGKISDADYAETVLSLRREAADALAALDPRPRPVESPKVEEPQERV